MMHSQEKLGRAFIQDGIVGGHLRPVLEAECECADFVITHFHDQLILGDSFQAFFVDTLQLAERRYRASPDFLKLQWYAHLLRLELANFRTVRAAEILFMHGRASHGYGLLRDLKDRALLLGAIGNGFVTLPASSGMDRSPDTSDPLASLGRMKKKRKNAEGEARSRMLGSKSELSHGTRTALRKWEEFFHLEVHGGRVTSLLEDEGWIKGKEPLPVLPKPNIESFGIYINRFGEVCWMVLRTFPMLQLQPADFGPAWAEKWQILDERFGIAAEGLQKQGKAIGSAIIEFVSCKFPFSPNKTYYSPEP